MVSKYFKFIFVFLLFFFQSSYSQLNEFTLNVSKTDETCTGNGSLYFTVQNQTPGSTLLYSIYLLPNVTTPIVTLPENTYTGLSAGIYRVVATQTLNNLSNTQQQDIEIFNTIVPLSYSIATTPQSCLNNASITVSVLTGVAVSYEILSGPIVFPPQSSNVFSNLVAGVYNVRVNDNCSDGIVQTVTLVTQTNSTSLSISDYESNCILEDCNTMSGGISITCAANQVISYPLTVNITIFPPSGVPIQIAQIINSGGNNSVSVNFDMPFFNNQNFNYSVSVTDACGVVSQDDNNVINSQLNFNVAVAVFNTCDQSLTLSPCNYLPPYTVEFLTTPAGFDPIQFNANHPGPFNTNAVYQPSVGNELPLGIYEIRITDACARTAINQIEVEQIVTDFSLIPQNIACPEVQEVTIPNQGPTITTIFLTSGPSELNLTLPFDFTSSIVNGYFNMDLLFPGTYVFNGTNICGDNYQIEVQILPFLPTVNITPGASIGCNPLSGYITITMQGGPQLVSVILNEAPPSYGQTLPQDISSLITSNNQLLNLGNLPLGDYVFTVLDSCGITHYPVSTTIAQNLSNAPLNTTILKGCDLNYASVRMISLNGPLQTIKITAAPTTFPFALPYDVSFNIAANGYFYMNNLPAGSYTFQSLDVCNVEKFTNVNVVGYQIVQNNVNVQENCGSFNVFMQFASNETYQNLFWLQKFDPITNQWKHPYTGVVYNDGTTVTALNSFVLTNNVNNINFALTGTFRVINTHLIFSNGTTGFVQCFDVLKTFDYDGILKIISAYTLPCSNGTNEVVVVAEGIDPLSYRITTRNGIPFIVNNLNSNIFSGLTPAIYNFQVQDICGNIVNRLFDIRILPEPSILPENLCEGFSGQLSVPNIAFLNYQWWKGTDTTTILSTTNTLVFNPFTSTTPGTYYVRIYSANSLSCVDQIISYTVPSVNNPNAGENQNIIICDASISINLFTLLVAPFDSNGVWEEISTSGMLNEYIWSPFNLPFGTYVFKYTVNGLCGSIDEAFITVNLNSGPPIPVLNGTQSICKGEDISISIGNINNSNVTYLWNGPNSFTSTNQNISIENGDFQNSGTYNVTAFLNGCQETASFDVTVLPIPEFTIEQKCVNNEYFLEVVPIENSFVPDISTFNWTGPNGFSSTNNPVLITNSPTGLYEVTVTNFQNCSSSLGINLSATLCSIPNVITPNNDGSNDSFDLTGLLVDNIEIYNRWGKLVYNKNNYVNEWIGQNNEGKLLPDSTYFYALKLQSGEIKTGWILVFIR
jgi:gliding motility-associated-like protein